MEKNKKIINEIFPKLVFAWVPSMARLSLLVGTSFPAAPHHGERFAAGNSRLGCCRGVRMR